MEFTTRFELQSQTTRLVDVQLTRPGERESHPLSCPVPRDLARPVMSPSLDHNSACHQRHADSHLELVPLQSPLLGESWLVSFPPLNYMLKFGGSSCLSWDLEVENYLAIKLMNRMITTLEWMVLILCILPHSDTNQYSTLQAYQKIDLPELIVFYCDRVQCDSSKQGTHPTSNVSINHHFNRVQS